MDQAKIVILTGGSFQGKSLIALRVASKYNFSGVIATDVVRNVLKVQNPSVDFLSTSTYTLPPKLLRKQMVAVSETVRSILRIYRERGEHVIIEGMHLSPGFLRWASGQAFCRICLNNTLPLSRRLILKSKTRSRLRFQQVQHTGEYFGMVDDSNVNTTVYMKYADRITQIHGTLVRTSEQNGFKRIDFDELTKGIEMVCHAIESSFRQL